MISWLRSALTDLRVHPGRSLLTAISLFLGVLAVMAIIVTGDVVREVFLATAEQQGGRYQTFERRVELPATTSHAQLIAALSDLPPAHEAHLGCIFDAPDGITIATLPESSGTLDQGVIPNISTAFVCGDYSSVYRLPLSAGRWLRADQDTAPYEIVVNHVAAHQLGGPGTTIWLTSPTTSTTFPALVVGVVNDGRTEAQAITTAFPWLSNAPQLIAPTSITLLWQQAGTSEDQVRSATNDWLTDHRLPTDSQPMETDTVAGFTDFIRLVQLSFAGVALLSLIVAALGIINVGLASVKERARELVIRRALGATKASIVGMIMGSALILSVLVAATATLIAWIALLIFRASLAPDSPVEPPGYPLIGALIGTAVSITTALIGSVIPGLIAARLQPGLALRE